MLSKARLSSETGLLTITEKQFENLKSLFFQIGERIALDHTREEKN